MNLDSVLAPLIGGALIGLAATLMLLFNGRVSGVSGILGGFITDKRDRSWRGAFLLGLLTGGGILLALRPDVFTNISDRSLKIIGLAGLLVGYGTSMGGGCTSGHGVCGVSRLSARSIIATLTFMAFGFLTVAVFQIFCGWRPMTKRQALAAFGVGLLFALGLGISGMTQPQKVIGFLDVWNWDPSLMFVMMGAVGVHAIACRFIIKRKSPLFDSQWHLPTRKDIDFNLIGGAAIFGIGWGLGGFCPGPVLTSLVTGDVRVVTFVTAMVAGIYIRSFK